MSQRTPYRSRYSPFVIELEKLVASMMADAGAINYTLLQAKFPEIKRRALYELVRKAKKRIGAGPDGRSSQAASASKGPSKLKVATAGAMKQFSKLPERPPAQSAVHTEGGRTVFDVLGELRSIHADLRWVREKGEFTANEFLELQKTRMAFFADIEERLLRLYQARALQNLFDSLLEGVHEVDPRLGARVLELLKEKDAGFCAQAGALRVL